MFSSFRFDSQSTNIDSLKKMLETFKAENKGNTLQMWEEKQGECKKSFQPILLPLGRVYSSAFPAFFVFYFGLVVNPTP